MVRKKNVLVIALLRRFSVSANLIGLAMFVGVGILFSDDLNGQYLQAQELIACADLDSVSLANLDDESDVNVGDLNKIRRENQRAFARYLEFIRDNESISETLRTNIEDYLALQDPDEISKATQTLVGVQRANLMTIAMNSPWRQAFNHTRIATRRDLGPRQATPGCFEDCEYRGQVPAGYAFYNPSYETGRSFTGDFSDVYPIGGFPNASWFSANYRGFDVKADDNSSKYGITDVGLNVGYQAGRGANAVGGVVFGYSQPHFSTDDTRANCSNFQLGAYGGGRLGDAWETSFYIGGGLQSYTHKRTASFKDLREYHRTSFDGQSFATAFKLGRSFQTDESTIWRPVIQFDYQQAWLDKAKESGEGLALVYNKSNWNQLFVRGGIELEYNTAFLLFDAHALYGYRLSGDSAPTMKVRFSGVDSDVAAKIVGVELGDSFGEAGLAARGYVDCERRLSVGAGYDFSVSDKSRAHLGTIGAAYAY